MRADCTKPKDGGEYRQASADARLAARGLSNRQIALALGANEHVVGRVREEYNQRGLAVLEDRARAGRPRSSRDQQSVQKMVETVSQAPAKGLSRWSNCAMAVSIVCHVLMIRCTRTSGHGFSGSCLPI
jgi:transposase